MLSTITPVLPLEIACIRKSPRENLVVRLSEYGGQRFVAIRVFDIASGAKARPTKKGATLQPKRIPELIAALQMAERRAGELGMRYEVRR